MSKLLIRSFGAPGAALLLTFFLYSPASAQVTAGSVAGIVKDQTSAVLPGVRVTIRNVATGATYEADSNQQGAITFPVVAIGDYTFTAELSGFKTATGQFAVQLNARSNLTMVLEVGQTTETVQVVGAQAPVETTSAQLAETFTTREVPDLPLPRQHSHCPSSDQVP